MTDTEGKLILLTKDLDSVLTVYYKNRGQRDDCLRRLLEICKMPVFGGCTVKVSPTYKGLNGYDKVRGVVRGYAKWPGNPMVQEIMYASKRGRRKAIANLQQTWPGLKFVHIVPELQNV